MEWKLKLGQRKGNGGATVTNGGVVSLKHGKKIKRKTSIFPSILFLNHLLLEAGG